MKISSKGRYAVRIIVEIAKGNGSCVSVAEIAKNQQISVKYLEQIINKLTKAGLLISIRGVNGGYKLAKPKDKYNVAEILDVTGDAPVLAPCLQKNSNCQRIKTCDAIGCWEALNLKIYQFLKSVSLQDILDKNF